MKKMIMILALVTTMGAPQAKAEALAGTYLFLTTSFPLFISTLVHCDKTRNCKEALEDVQAAQDYAQNGQLSGVFAQKVKDLQTIADLSEAEAVDIIALNAEEYLK